MRISRYTTPFASQSFRLLRSEQSVWNSHSIKLFYFCHRISKYRNTNYGHLNNNLCTTVPHHTFWQGILLSVTRATMGLLKWCSCLKKNQMEDVRILDFSHSHLVDVPPDVFQYERTLEELHLEANRVSI